jgi:hypothetical protein
MILIRIIFFSIIIKYVYIETGIVTAILLLIMFIEGALNTLNIVNAQKCFDIIYEKLKFLYKEQNEVTSKNFIAIQKFINKMIDLHKDEYK